jgi:O-antigen/teichoic acid export membrane protein
MKKNKYMLLFSNTIIFAIGSILVKLISLFLMPLYTSSLEKGEYGIAELLNSGVEIIFPIATLCIIDALFRFAIEDDANFLALFANSTFILSLGSIIVLVGTIIAWYAFEYQYAWHFFLLFITTSAFKMTTQFARGLGHVKRFAFYGVLNALVLVSSNIILLVVLKYGIGGYLFSYSIGYGVSAVFAFLVSNEYRYVNIRGLNFSVMREMLRFSLPNIPNMISWWINSVSDRYILSFFCGSDIGGLYTAASKIPAITNLVSSIFQQAWQYSTTKEITSKDSTNFFSNIFRVYMYLCCVSCGVIIISNRFICKLLLQSSFFEAWKYVPLLILAATFGCISTYYGTFYQALKNNKMLMVSTVVGACVNIVLNIIFIPIYEAFGAAIATVISYILVTIIRVIDVNKKVKIQSSRLRVIIQISSIICISLIGSIANQSWALISIFFLWLIIIFSDIELVTKGFKVIKGKIHKK